MPELPEVETIRRGLEKRIVGKTITDIEIKSPKNFLGDKMDVRGLKVIKVERRAKVLAIRLEKDKNLLFHLKMTGQLIWRSPNEISNYQLSVSNQISNSKYQKTKKNDLDQFAGGHPDHSWHLPLPSSATAVIFTFGDNSKLYFNDLRKFGWCKVLSDEQLKHVFTEEYGLEPFDPKFVPEYLMGLAKKIPNRKIKQFLTDQKIIAGIGNIYVDESLFAAKISPVRKVKDVTKAEWKKIIQSVKKILELGIKHGGTTDSDYVNADGEKGGMQNYLMVYRKVGQDCPNNCGDKIKRIVVGGRGTHFCPECQK